MTGFLDELSPEPVSTHIDVLHLHAAFLEEPILQAGDGLVLVHVQACVEIKEVIRAHELPLRRAEGHGAGDVAATTDGAGVIAIQVFTM